MNGNGQYVSCGGEPNGTWLYGAMIILWGICTDLYESASCGFWDGGVALNLSVNRGLSHCDCLWRSKILL